jgi:hypothetical protein
VSSDPALVAQIFAEFARLGLRLDESPHQAFAAGPGGAEHLLETLRDLRAGATWHDVFPDMPASWVPGRPATWTTLYRPLGPFDYPTLPTGPAVHVTGRQVWTSRRSQRSWTRRAPLAGQCTARALWNNSGIDRASFTRMLFWIEIRVRRRSMIFWPGSMSSPA